MSSSDPSKVASEIESLLVALKQAELGSDAALDLIGLAVSKITYFAGDHIDRALPEMGDVTDENNFEFQRKAAAALRPLLMSYGFYGELADEILRGLWSLENGVTPPALKACPRPGSRFSIEIREQSLRLVILAEFVKKTVGNTAAYEAKLQECGVNLSSVREYRKQLGLFSTGNVEDPYRAENMLRILNAEPPLTSEQKLIMAMKEIRAIKSTMGKRLKIKDK